MKLFSQRTGLKKTRTTIQKKSINDDLRNGLWNIYKIFLWDTFKGDFLDRDPSLYDFFKCMWMFFLKRPLDDLDLYWKNSYSQIRDIFYNFKWYEVYDFLEFTAEYYPKEEVSIFLKACNSIFESEFSAYRFVNKTINEITSEEEIRSIENAQANSPKNSRTHLDRALKLLGKRS